MTCWHVFKENNLFPDLSDSLTLDFSWTLSKVCQVFITSIELYTSIPVLMTLIVFQSHRGTRKVELHNSSYPTQLTFCMVVTMLELTCIHGQGHA